MTESIPPLTAPISLSTYHQLSLTAESANIRNTGIFKPNPYLQLMIDDKISRKTEVIKNTLHPKWKEDFTVLVTPLSQLLFRLADHHSFRKDNIIGEKKISLLKILLLFNGKCENIELTIDLMKAASQENSSSSNGEVKTAELVILLDGLRIDPSVLSQSHDLHGEMSSSRGSLTEGVRARIRMRNNPDTVRTIIRSQNLRPPPGPPPMSNGSVHGVAVLPRVSGLAAEAAAADNGAGPSHAEPPHASEPSATPPAGSASTSGEDPLPPGWEMRYDLLLKTTPSHASEPSATPPASSASTSGEDPLPPGWEMRYDVYGPHASEPSATPPAGSASTSGEDPLPPGWEMRYDVYGRRARIRSASRASSTGAGREDMWSRRGIRDSSTRSRNYRINPTRTTTTLTVSVYYNTRTTTWQRPDTERLARFSHWCRQRRHVVAQGNQRFLYPQPQLPHQPDADHDHTNGEHLLQHAPPPGSAPTPSGSRASSTGAGREDMW
ncbi:c2 domain-containing protein [Phthorimaea operculella]|nr:c2 domain-containing protein [Phthorimaea operculella]